MTHRFGGGDAMLPTAMVGVSLAAAGYSSGGACPWYSAAGLNL